MRTDYLKWFSGEIKKEIAFPVSLSTAQQCFTAALAKPKIISDGIIIATKKYSGHISGDEIYIDLFIRNRTTWNYRVHAKLFSYPAGCRIAFTIKNENPFPFIPETIFGILIIAIMVNSLLGKIIFSGIFITLSVLMLRWNYSMAAQTITEEFRQIIMSK